MCVSENLAGQQGVRVCGCVCVSEAPAHCLRVCLKTLLDSRVCVCAQACVCVWKPLLRSRCACARCWPVSGQAHKAACCDGVFWWKLGCISEADHLIIAEPIHPAVSFALCFPAFQIFSISSLFLLPRLLVRLMFSLCLCSFCFLFLQSCCWPAATSNACRNC